MILPTAEDFKTELQQRMYEAMQEGKDSMGVDAGELHKRAERKKRDPI